MATQIKIANSFSDKDNLVFLADEKTNWKNLNLLSPQIQYIQQQIKIENKTIAVPQLSRTDFIILVSKKDKEHQTREEFRKAGNTLTAILNKQKIESVTIINTKGKPQTPITLAFAEGMALGNYQFLKYKSKDTEKQTNSLKNIFIHKNSAAQKEIEQLQISVDATCIARDLINEFPANQTAVMLSEEFKKLGKQAGFKVTVLNKEQIEKAGMGGLIAVNRGSKTPPTFSIMEWKPSRVVNKNPMVLVGKGIVYDTGGLSLKPTANSMDYMKCDMGGSAVVAGVMFAVAKAKLPVHLIGLVPATDNRPGEDAYVPGDVVKMHNGMTVEVLNTDAEGRMVLADALSYAQQYKPKLVIDLATLTGAVVAALGTNAMGMMSTADITTNTKLQKSGEAVYERLVEFPLWDEYAEQIKSDIADIKNIGTGGQARTIIGGMFLKNFVDFPWIHLDIAGVAFLHKPDSYRVKNGTGTGVRLLFDFFQKTAKRK